MHALPCNMYQTRILMNYTNQMHTFIKFDAHFNVRQRVRGN